VAVQLEITLFGTCMVRMIGGSEVTGAKHRALFALLVTAPLGRRSRTYLQETLWGLADYESGHQNLRRALSDLRKSLGDVFEAVLTVTTTEIEIDMTRIKVRGTPSDGPFLDDLNVREAAFVAWRDENRAKPGRVEALCTLSRTRTAQRLQPRVCALPLSVPPGDTDLAVAADWIAEETSRMMSRSSLVQVISHLSGRAMSQRRVDVEGVRDTLDVDYLITGAMRKSGDHLIADIDFVDTRTGTLLWNRNLHCRAAHFTDEASDWLVNVVQTVGRAIAETTLEMARATPLPELPDHKLLIAGATAMHHPTLGDFMRARQLLDEAAERAPHSPHIHAWLGKWYVLNIFKNYTTDRAADTQKALDSTARALDLDPMSSFSLTIDGFARANILRDLTLAEDRYTAAQNINPNESLAWLLRGSLKAFQDEGRSAVRATETARRLSPIDPFGYYFDSLASSAHLAAGNYEMAYTLAEKSLRANDRHISTLRARIAALHALDRGEEARVAAQDLQRRFPNFTLDDYRRTHPVAGSRVGLLVTSALEAAGLN
jgi:TolB-like protein